MAHDKFQRRHIGIDDQDLKEMLKVIGVKSVDELIGQVIPPQIHLKELLPLEPSMTEHEYAEHVRELASMNTIVRTLIGMGYYGTASPAAIIRNIFENPAWYTSYTPYQAEISQGRLEALLNFQTMVTSLTGMDISNCSLLDEATGAAEAMSMMYACRSREAIKEERNLLFVDENIFPQTLDLLVTRSEPLGIKLAVADFEGYKFTGKEFGAILQYPAATGEIRDYAAFTATCHENDILVTAVVDILALALIKSPAEWGADVVVGSTQRFGIPMNFGGPHSGYLATKDQFKRDMPGRIIGVSVDRLGNKALRMALQTREQHIKRERATSNLCTAQALLATMAGMFAVYHGPEGIRRIALHAHGHAVAFAEAVEKLGYNVLNENYFDTVEVEADIDNINALCEEVGLNLFFPAENIVHISFDENSSLDELNALVAIFAEAVGKESFVIESIEDDKIFFDSNLSRTSPILQEKVFNRYHSETELMRYIKKLERRDISLANSMISLGSCTMKLNPAAAMLPLSLSEFGGIHPFAPEWQADGYLEMIEELNHDLSIITGFDRMSFQPNSGANGEYAGLMVIRAYHKARGEGHRNIALIPASAHGTNPASAVMAGLKVVVTKTDENGNIDVEDWKAKAAEHADNLACSMITYPSTHGIFESRIIEIIETVHKHGGQVYYDGANLNAVVGLTSPGHIGADVCHLNLHKTFAIPHGGGGPGIGAIGVAEHLTPFLPTHTLVDVGGEQGMSAVAAAPYGSPLVLLVTYAYIKMLGAEGLKRSTEIAIVSANYMANALKGKIDTVYSGETGRVGHEMILDYRKYRQMYGVETGDIARRLMDYGFHAPTLSFPVNETLMVEPTESESKAELDRFISTLIQIQDECEAIKDGKSDKDDNLLKNAPHTAAELIGNTWSHPYSREEAAFPLPWVVENKFFPYVTKVDAGYGDRNLDTSSVSLDSIL